MLELIDGIIAMLEPPESRIIEVDDSGAEPLSYQPETLYVFEAGPDERRLAGNSPNDLNYFSLVAVYTVDDAGERAAQQRSRAVTAKLDAQRETYLRAVRRNRVGPSDEEGRPLWGHIEASADADFVRALEVRGIAITLRGWRLVEE